jgi:hypothetical protein
VIVECLSCRHVGVLTAAALARRAIAPDTPIAAFVKRLRAAIAAAKACLQPADRRQSPRRHPECAIDLGRAHRPFYSRTMAVKDAWNFRALQRFCLTASTNSYMPVEGCRCLRCWPFAIRSSLILPRTPTPVPSSGRDVTPAARVGAYRI